MGSGVDMKVADLSTSWSRIDSLSAWLQLPNPLILSHNMVNWFMHSTYSVPHYKTRFLIFGHLIDYLQNHAVSTHNTSKWSLLFTESFDTYVNTSRDNHMTQYDSKQ